MFTLSLCLEFYVNQMKMMMTKKLGIGIVKLNVKKSRSLRKFGRKNFGQKTQTYMSYATSMKKMYW